MARAVYGIAKTEAQADRIVSELEAAGFENERLSVLLPDRTGARDLAHEKGTKAPPPAWAPAEPWVARSACWPASAPWPSRASDR